jgi:heat shock protein HtpX
MKRIVLFILTNLAVLAVLSVAIFVIERIFGVRLPQNGLGGLLVFAALCGFGGALISLALSKWTAKAMMGVRVIDAPQSESERWLVDTVARLAGQARIGMPQVGIFEAEEMNAFATGARRNAALVAVSTGLVRDMSRPQVEAVLGHEITHVSNGDMVTLALLQGVLNTFVIFPRTHHRRPGRPRIVQERPRRIRHRILPDHARGSDRTRHLGEHDRRLVLAAARIPRRPRRRRTRGH